MATIGLRELGQQVKPVPPPVPAHERLVVTDRGRPGAMISPSRTSPDPGIETLIRAGLAEMGGGTPQGTPRRSRRPRRIEGRPGARIVIEERR